MLEKIVRDDSSLEAGKIKLMADLQEIQDDEIRQLLQDTQDNVSNDASR